jgi:hypothetical protein
VPEGRSLEGGKRVLLAYFVGGVSYMEIAALRFLSRQRDFPFSIIVATTKITNGAGLVMACRQVPYLKRNANANAKDRDREAVQRSPSGDLAWSASGGGGARGR